MKIRFIWTLIISFFIYSLSSSCNKNKIEKDDEFTLQRSSYSGNTLRINGYYYREYTIDDETTNCIHFFYRNGVLLDANCTNVENIEATEERFTNGVFYQWVFDAKQSWGLFNVDNNIVKFEKYYPSSGSFTGSTGMRAYIKQGNILNDTTFQITESYRMIDGVRTEWNSANEIYHFKEICPKPDSLNPFVP